MKTVPSPGQVVRVRGCLWTIGRVIRHDDCAEVSLVPEAAGFAGADQSPVTLLTPFDRPVPVPARHVPVVVSRRRWMAAFRTALVRSGDRALLGAAARANLDLLPHQFEPAIETIRRGSPRLLLADAVGLGKTIQAGLVLAELTGQGALERALILTQPGLRDQWCGELRQRFGIAATIADAGWLRAMRAAWPASLNPWSVPGVLTASIDFVKRPEVRRSLADVWWDVVIVDEAHTASSDSDRREAAHRCASRARRVLLLTATPHAGDDEAFASLTRIGALADDEPIVVFRRSRADAGLPSRRRVRLLRVRGTAGEGAVHRALREYVRAVWARSGLAERDQARLAMVVLVKRSLSGMAALARSLEARHDALAGKPPASDGQCRLPWDDDLEEADRLPVAVLGAPGLQDVAGERAWLARLIGLAHAAVAGDSKLRALRRLLRRIHEPVIVFTEYRDTLATVAAALEPGADVAVLHGGLEQDQRRDVIARFTSGRVPRLVATDAAGAGLNLQARCRVIVNLELPWNPMRLEQRIGRVDRIGQLRTVHAVNLLARATAEGAVLARLARRLAKADAAVGSIEQVTGWSDEEVAETWIEGHEMPALAEATAASCAHGVERAPASPVLIRPDHRGEAAMLAGQLQRHRALLAAGFPSTDGPGSIGPIVGRAFRPAVTAVTAGAEAPAYGRNAQLRMASSCIACAIAKRRLPAPLSPGGVLAIVDTCDELVPVFVPQRIPPLRRRADVRAHVGNFLRTHARQVVRVAEEAAAARQADRRTESPFPTGRLAERDEHLATLARTSSGLQQPGLFDRRAECVPAARQFPRRWLPSTSLRAGEPAPTTVQEGAKVAGPECAADDALLTDDHDRGRVDRTPCIRALLLITAHGGSA